MPGAVTVQADLPSGWHAFFQKHIVAVDFTNVQHLFKGQAELCMFVLSHLLISMWQRYFSMLGLSRYYAAAGKMIQSSFINSVTNLLDEKYSDIAMPKLETIPTLRYFFTCDI